MKIFLDTNAFLKWTLEERVPRKVERLISSESSDLLASIITPWEISIKQARWHEKKMSNGRIAEAIQLVGAQILPILIRHVDALGSLPDHHSDPFDRMLIAQAISEKALIVSSDERFPLYKAAGLKVAWA